MLIDVQIHVNANSRISRVLESAPICLQFGGLLARQPSRRHLHLPSARLSDMSDSWEDGGSPEASELELFQQEVVEAAAFRQSNSLAAVTVKRQQHEANKKNLKSDLKKTTTFVKKIRTINAEGLLQCIKDVETLNLSLYIDEIINAIAETAYKATDVPNIVKLCTSLHVRYDSFTKPLNQAIKAQLLAASVGDGEEGGREAGVKRRIQIRLICELFQAGFFNDEAFFMELFGVLSGRSQKVPFKLMDTQTNVYILIFLSGRSAHIGRGDKTRMAM